MTRKSISKQDWVTGCTRYKRKANRAVQFDELPDCHCEELKGLFLARENATTEAKRTMAEYLLMQRLRELCDDD